MGASPVRELLIGSVIGRSSAAMISVGTVLLIQNTTGSFAFAGSAAGTFALFSVVVGPVRSWFTVRCGHRLTLLILAGAQALGLIALTAAATRHWPAWQILALTALVGAASPPFGALMRVGWSRALPEPVLPKAFGIDAVCEEVTLMVGPLLVGAAVALAGTRTSLLISSGLCLAGAVTMAAGAPSAHGDDGTPQAHVSVRSAVRGAAPVLVALAAVGLTVGMIEVGVPALTEEFGRVALAGPLLAVLSAASACGAFVYGRIAERAPLERWLVWLSVGAALGTALLAAAVGLFTLVPLLVIAGLAVGPAVMTGYLMADRVAEGHAGKTHAAILAGVACNGGTAAGAAASGLLIGSAGTHTAFLAVAGTAVLAIGASRLLPSPTAPARSGAEPARSAAKGTS
ncbi:MFS transporter [Streptomyces sp. NPDC006012]|uniref:MFS transporter n=1 Tax=Streptomyces sp. NPDC006012 TaxID=3364739 RepID=UPI0036B3B034